MDPSRDTPERRRVRQMVESLAAHQRARPEVRRRSWDTRRAPALLTLGTPGQIGLAEEVRTAMLRRAKVAGLGKTAAVIASVTDARWFLANKATPLDELRWPQAHQMED